ncbi:MAG: hypothetical protein KAR19_11070 [Bacteroidales bacterium]|nr:hypothetical protein [Bacteroidales bacterium]
MNRIMKGVLFLITVLVLTSCEKSMNEVEMLGANADIVGTWIENGYEDDVTLFERAEILDHLKYGFTINGDGTFVERKNIGWCGTPPITYDNFKGDWVALSDSLLEITVGYWGGTMTYQMRIVFLDQDSLGIRYLYAEDRADSK